MNNLPKTFSNMYGGLADSTTFNQSMKQYQELGIKISDRPNIGNLSELSVIINTPA